MPAYGNSVGMDKGYDAETAIAKYAAVKLGTTAEGVAAITGLADRAIGVSLFHVTASEISRGKGATVREMGIVEWAVGAAVAKGDPITIDAIGRAVTAVSGKRVYGYARQVAANANEVIAIAVDFVNTPILA